MPAPGGKATVDIEVDAAPWISVSRVILYVTGKEANRWPVPESQDVVRFRIRHEITLPIDGYAVVRVDGDKIMAPVVGDNKTFGVYPLALTNPIFFDVNGNGRYDPEHPHGPQTSACLAGPPGTGKTLLAPEAPAGIFLA